jgi:hypothetical protein
MAGPTVESLEGRLMAQRKLLALIVAELGGTQGTGDRLWEFLEERTQFQDGEEDPGVMPSTAHGIEGAMADELRLIAEAARRYATGSG